MRHRSDEDIPNHLLYPGWQTDKDEDGQTPLMYWNRYRKGEAVPDALRDVPQGDLTNALQDV